MTLRNVSASVILLFLAWTPFAVAQSGGARTPDGRPDLSGTYNGATLTPLERPVQLADRKFLTQEEVDRIAQEERELMTKGDEKSVADRSAPAVGGAAIVGFEDQRAAGEALGAGNVGGYNTFWFDRGTGAFAVDGRYRTSILTDPPNGRRPPMQAEAQARLQAFVSNFMRNDGTAWWLEEEGPGPYDDIEMRPAAERCLLGFVEGPPMIPALYNNYVRVVQTPNHVMILNEMIHDARIVRIDSEHRGEELRHWLGDSIGWWEGDVLVIETKHFRDETGLTGASRHMTVTERLSRMDGGSLQYEFTVDDPTVWTATWTGDFVWSQTDDKIYEYACHEGNHSLGGIMRGARLLEQDAEATAGGG